MSDQDWSRIVFRLRKIPNHISSPTEVASLLSGILGLPSDHVIVYSIAKTSDMWEVPPSKVATLQLKSVPACLQPALADIEWSLPIPGGRSADVLILDTHFEGMTVLHDVDPAKHRADCIAISGLASHPFGSWQPGGQDKTFMWIRDAIPASIPGVRTVIYGYGSKLLGSKSFQSISDISRSFVLHLKSGSWNLPSSKPIIFLAHSLGGLVLKDSIVQIADREKSVAGILDNVRGAIMFGVPSLGMEQSHLMSMVEGQVNESLIQDLSREGGGNYVRQLNTQFDGLSFVRTARILWAYETEVSPTVVQRTDGTWDRLGPHTVLVNPESATSHYYRKDKSLTIPIHKDHSNMVKFTRGDSCLGLIIVSIAEMCSSKQLASESLPAGLDGTLLAGEGDLLGFGAQGSFNEDLFQDSEVDQVLQDLGRLLSSVEEMHNELYSPELDFRVDSIEDPYQNTFKWVFELPIFSTWLQEESGLFWIHGKPGSGKSTLMKLIFQSRQTWELLHNWKAGSLEIKAGFFFHYRGTAIQKSFEGVLRSLIIQVLAPHRDSYRKRHQATWEKFEPAKQQQAKLRTKLARLKRIHQATQMEIEKVARDLVQLRLKDDAKATGSPGGAKVGAKGADKLHKDFHERRRILESRKAIHDSEIRLVEEELTSMEASLASLAKSFRPYSTAPETRFLRDVVTTFRDDKDGLIPKLERVLRQLLDQDTIRMDLVLFFDALDEFDGHLDMISRFLKSLLNNSGTSATRVKVCMSSRPWEPLKAHFSSYPGFALQDHTKHDIEEYAACSVASSPAVNQSIFKLVPTIIERANGVFLWVKLALKVLLETAMLEPGNASPDLLEKKLQELPSDLFEFYKLIIERISKKNRRRTFALLELLIRQHGPPATASQIRDAVLLSSCTTFGEATDELERANQACLVTEAHSTSVRNDIYTWGGGLVEIKTQNGVSRPQLMHQTILEFTMGLWFKKIVMGDLASILQENGHSFHVKYRLAVRASRWKRLPAPKPVYLEESASGRPEPTAFTDEPIHLPRDIRRELQQIAYHAEQSELTTGRSQFKFLYSIPVEDLANLDGYNSSQHWGSDRTFLSMAASFGLTLCLRDWITRNPTGATLRYLTTSFHWPLLTPLIYEHPGGVFHERYLTTARLLLENGYSMEQDPKFFPSIVTELWATRSKTSPGLLATPIIPIPALHTLAKLILDYGQNPDVRVEVFARGINLNSCVPLHMAPPPLAAELLRHGANPNATDSYGCTPLDWVLDHPFEPLVRDRLDCAQKYEMCNMLVKAGGITSRSLTRSTLLDSLAEFEKEGYDTALIRQPLTAQAKAKRKIGQPLPLLRVHVSEAREDDQKEDKKNRRGKRWTDVFRLNRKRQN